MMSKRLLSFRPVRLARRLAVLGAVISACALGGCGSTSASGSSGYPPLVVGGGVVRAHTLPGDQLEAGPVLLHHRAVWVEAGRRLLVRSLDAHGRTRTIFSTSKTPGAPKGIVWPFWVASIAAGGGRVAFEEGVIPCASAPPHLMRCMPSTVESPADSITVFAGRPGAIRPVQTLMHPGRHCRKGQAEPGAVAVADVGVVDYETSVYSCRPGFSRLVLRSFSGRLVRVLAGELPVETKDFAVAGGRVAFVRSYEATKGTDELKIVRLGSGRTVLRLRRRCMRGIGAVALERSGRFALVSAAGHGSSSCRQPRVNTLRVGQIGHPGLRTIARDVQVRIPATSIAMAGGYVAYARQTGSSRSDTQVMVAAPGATPNPIPGMKPGAAAPLAFDGHVVATAHDNTVQLVALRRA